jgi:Cys-rich protein (TIGR01571 family)
VKIDFSRMQNGQWNSGLCDCCSNPVCCMACCCPCCVYGQIVAAMGPQETIFGGNYCSGCCCFYSLHCLSQLIDSILASLTGIPFGTILFPFSTIIHCPTRGEIRRKYNIPGSDSDDCLVVWCCMCCALAQVLFLRDFAIASWKITRIRIWFCNVLFCRNRTEARSQEHKQVTYSPQVVYLPAGAGVTQPHQSNTMQPTNPSAPPQYPTGVPSNPPPFSPYSAPPPAASYPAGGGHGFPPPPPPAAGNYGAPPPPPPPAAGYPAVGDYGYAPTPAPAPPAVGGYGMQQPPAAGGGYGYVPPVAQAYAPPPPRPGGYAPPPPPPPA